MEFDNITPLNILILVFSMIVAMYPLISRGYVFIESPPPILIESGEIGDKKWFLLSKLVYVDRKTELLYFNGIFSLVGTLYEVHMIDVVYIFIGVVLYVSLAGNDLFSPGTFKRYMTLPITREEYILGRIFPHILIIWLTLSITYIGIMFSFLPLDLSVLISGLILMPILILIICLSFLISSIVKNVVISFLVSGGFSVVSVLFIDQIILSLFSFTKYPMNFSPIHGYIYVIGLYNDIQSLGEAGRPYAIMTDTYYFDVTTNLVLFMGYVLSFVILALGTLFVLTFLGRKIEVD